MLCKIAKRCCGVARLIVSKHGGRALDTRPAIAQKEGSEPLLQVNGRTRRGTEVFKAMALGASAVLVGRPVTHGLANAGVTGWRMCHRSPSLICFIQHLRPLFFLHP